METKDKLALATRALFDALKHEHRFQWEELTRMISSYVKAVELEKKQGEITDEEVDSVVRQAELWFRVSEEAGSYCQSEYNEQWKRDFCVLIGLEYWYSLIRDSH